MRGEASVDLAAMPRIRLREGATQLPNVLSDEVRRRFAEILARAEAASTSRSDSLYSRCEFQGAFSIKASVRPDFGSKSPIKQGSVLADPIAHYSPEMHIFPALTERFATTGDLDPLGMYALLDWKSPRARTKHLKRLAGIAGSFSAAVRLIATQLHAATTSEQRFGLLLTTWKFRPPTASAILAILYPDTFTIYDIRVCNALGDFHQLDHMAWSPNFWQEYERYVARVRAIASERGLSLRDGDRWLWGQNKRDTLVQELGEHESPIRKGGPQAAPLERPRRVEIESGWELVFCPLRR